MCSGGLGGLAAVPSNKEANFSSQCVRYSVVFSDFYTGSHTNFVWTIGAHLKLLDPCRTREKKNNSFRFAAFVVGYFPRKTIGIAMIHA